jgi:hypothetical protein
MQPETLSRGRLLGRETGHNIGTTHRHYAHRHACALLMDNTFPLVLVAGVFLL